MTPLDQLVARTTRSFRLTVEDRHARRPLSAGSINRGGAASAPARHVGDAQLNVGIGTPPVTPFLLKSQVTVNSCGAGSLGTTRRGWKCACQASVSHGEGSSPGHVVGAAVRWYNRVIGLVSPCSTSPAVTEPNSWIRRATDPVQPVW